MSVVQTPLNFLLISMSTCLGKYYGLFAYIKHCYDDFMPFTKIFMYLTVIALNYLRKTQIKIANLTMALDNILIKCRFVTLIFRLLSLF